MQHINYYHLCASSSTLNTVIDSFVAQYDSAVYDFFHTFSALFLLLILRLSLDSCILNSGEWGIAMRLTMQQLEHLSGYTGTTPTPEDFDLF